MKVRIVEPGWAGFSGYLGMVEFVDGVSAGDIGRGDAAALAALVAIEDLATDKSPSAAQLILDSNTHQMPVEAPVIAQAAPAPVIATTYTREQLEQIADKGGIKALRELAEPMGLKDNSIVQLIDKVLAHQALAVTQEPSASVADEAAAPAAAE